MRVEVAIEQASIPLGDPRLDPMVSARGLTDAPAGFGLWALGPSGQPRVSVEAGSPKARPAWSPKPKASCRRSSAYALHLLVPAPRGRILVPVQRRPVLSRGLSDAAAQPPDAAASCRFRLARVVALVFAIAAPAVSADEDRLSRSLHEHSAHSQLGPTDTAPIKAAFLHLDPVELGRLFPAHDRVYLELPRFGVDGFLGPGSLRARAGPPRPRGAHRVLRDPAVRRHRRRPACAGHRPHVSQSPLALRRNRHRHSAGTPSVHGAASVPRRSRVAHRRTENESVGARRRAGRMAAYRPRRDGRLVGAAGVRRRGVAFRLVAGRGADARRSRSPMRILPT